MRADLQAPCYLEIYAGRLSLASREAFQNSSRREKREVLYNTEHQNARQVRIKTLSRAKNLQCHCRESDDPAKKKGGVETTNSFADSIVLRLFSEARKEAVLALLHLNLEPFLHPLQNT